MRGSLWLVVATLLSASGATAAPSVTVRVNAKGTLVFTPQDIRSLGARPKPGQLLCVQFPKPHPKKIRINKPKGPGNPNGEVDEINAADRAPRLYTGLSRDGGLIVVRTRVMTTTGMVPGPPGTQYQAVFRKKVIELTVAG